MAPGVREGGREGAGKWELEREHWGDCRAGGAAGTDATSGSLQKAGLQQGWMLTALSGPLSRDSFQGRFPGALSRGAFQGRFLRLSVDSFQRVFPETLSKDAFQDCFLRTLSRGTAF